METRVIAIETPSAFSEAVAAAEKCLRAGSLVGVPTETVYGLAASALDEQAVLRIFEVKGRPRHNPLIVHVSSLEMARDCAPCWPAEAIRLAERFWPGPLTLVLPRNERIPAVVTAGGDTVALRWPSHPFMQALITACGFPIAAPSANLANQVSPTDARHVAASLAGKIPLIIDAGPSAVGIESTVVQISSSGWRLLRPGTISGEDIQQALGSAPEKPPRERATLRSPGLLKRHYSPRAALRVIRWRDQADLEAQARAAQIPLDRIHVLAHEHIPRSAVFGRVAVIPHDPEAYARALYAELHLCDAEGAQLILVEEVPQTSAWDGIRDRLTRASAPKQA